MSVKHRSNEAQVKCRTVGAQHQWPPELLALIADTVFLVLWRQYIRDALHSRHMADVKVLHTCTINLCTKEISTHTSRTPVAFHQKSQTTAAALMSLIVIRIMWIFIRLLTVICSISSLLMVKKQNKTKQNSLWLEIKKKRWTQRIVNKQDKQGCGFEEWMLTLKKH